MAITQGTYKIGGFTLPDSGFTEWLVKSAPKLASTVPVNPNRSPQQSPALQGPRLANNLYYSGSTGKTLGTSSTGLQNLASNPAPASGGGGGGGGNPPMEDRPSQPSINFDALINPVLEQLSQSEAAAQSLFSAQQGDIESAKATNAKRLGQTLTDQDALLTQGAEEQTMEGESAADQARRQFAEIQQGLQARYGNTTGTGAFAAELAGRDTMGIIANIRRGVTSALKEINDKKAQIKELGRIALEDIENNASQQITQARSQLESTLSNIRGQRGQLQARKAELAMTAMQNYQALVADIDARNTAFKQQLYLQQQDAQAKLNEAQTRARSIQESFSVRNMQQGKQITPVLVGNQGTVKSMSGQPITDPGALYGIGGSVPKPDDDFLSADDIRGGGY